MRLTLSVAPCHFRGDLVAYTSDNVSIAPRLTCWKLLVDLRKSLMCLPCRFALHSLRNLARRIPRRRVQQYAYTVSHYLHGVHLEPMSIRYSPKHFFSALSDLTCQEVLPALGYPHYTVLEIKDDMFRPPNAHAAVMQQEAPRGQTLLPSPSASRFPPTSKPTDVRRSSP